MYWAAMSPVPHRKPELMTWVLTGWKVRQFWYHFQSLNMAEEKGFTEMGERELREENEIEEGEKGRGG